MRLQLILIFLSLGTCKAQEYKVKTYEQDCDLLADIYGKERSSMILGPIYPLGEAWKTHWQGRITLLENTSYNSADCTISFDKENSIVKRQFRNSSDDQIYTAVSNVLNIEGNDCNLGSSIKPIRDARILPLPDLPLISIVSYTKDEAQEYRIFQDGKNIHFIHRESDFTTGGSLEGDPILIVRNVDTSRNFKIDSMFIKSGKVDAIKTSSFQVNGSSSQTTTTLDSKSRIKTLVEFDDKDRLRKRMEYTYEGEKSSSVVRTTWEYSRYSEAYSFTEETMNFDASGSLSEINSRFKNMGAGENKSDVAWRTQYYAMVEKNDAKQEIIYSRSQKRGSPSYMRYTYIYDSNGSLTYGHFEVDINMKAIKQKIFTFELRPLELDKAKNWITSELYLNNVLNDTIQRKIDYF